jgi:hypothetical protein
MPKKQQLNTRVVKRISDEIEKAFHHGWLVRSSLHGCLKKNDSILLEWNKMLGEITRLRSSIPAELKKRISPKK